MSNGPKYKSKKAIRGAYESFKKGEITPKEYTKIIESEKKRKEKEKERKRKAIRGASESFKKGETTRKEYKARTSFPLHATEGLD